MCTAMHIGGNLPLFGRTLDLERSMNERVVFAPRGYRFSYHEKGERSHYALLGVAHVFAGAPFYFDAVNEKGLAAAALNFLGCAVYQPPRDGAENIPSFALISRVLGECATLGEARAFLEKVNITGESAARELPATPLHWLIADSTGAIAVEPLAEGLRVFENPFGVLTNAPPFSYHATHLADYSGLSANPPENKLCKGTELPFYARGLGAVGLPGDFASASRFVRAVFVKNQTTEPQTERGAVSQFFHLLGAVSVPEGAIVTEEGRAVKTVYTACADLKNVNYYFTTYQNCRIRAISMSDLPLDSKRLLMFEMAGEEDVERLLPI